MSIAREGWPLIGGLLGAAAVLALVRLPWVAAVVAVLAVFTLWFFRDPQRRIPAGDKLVVSPADGKVVRVTTASGADSILGAEALQVSIFLSVFDVHINRAPVAGTIESVEYQKGEFLPAFDHDASHRNERNAVVVEAGETRVGFTQIAGLIARRIVFRKAVGDRVERGERVGMIKFGSRVDVFLPAGSRLQVAVGDRVAGGRSVIGELP